MQDRKRKGQKITIVGKCRTGKCRTIFGVKSEGGKCMTGKWRNKFGVKPEGGKCGTGKWRTGKWRPEIAGPSTCAENAGIMLVIGTWFQ